LAKSIHSEEYRELVARLAEARRAAGSERRLDVVEFLAMAAAVGVDPMPMVGEAWRRIEAG